MRLRSGRSKSKRARQRGAATIEFALSLVLFLPLILGILDYGYYFYVAVTAVEAARVGARQIANQTVGNCANAAAVLAARNLVIAPMMPGPAGAATVYMNQIGLGGNTTVTASCGTAPVDPTWNIKVQVDFRPAVGFLRAGMHASAIAGDVEFSQTLYVLGQ
jgi:Flp pilus assembly protein TadG